MNFKKDLLEEKEIVPDGFIYGSLLPLIVMPTEASMD